jgi:hypothetical protein
MSINARAASRGVTGPDVARPGWSDGRDVGGSGPVHSAAWGRKRRSDCQGGSRGHRLRRSLSGTRTGEQLPCSTTARPEDERVRSVWDREKSPARGRFAEDRQGPQRAAPREGTCSTGEPELPVSGWPTERPTAAARRASRCATARRRLAHRLSPAAPPPGDPQPPAAPKNASAPPLERRPGGAREGRGPQGRAERRSLGWAAGVTAHRRAPGGRRARSLAPEVSLAIAND